MMSSMTKQMATYYVMDPKLCEPREWSGQCVEWPGVSVEDAAADAALFWAKGDAEDDHADIDGTSRTVIAATRSDGADAREYEILIRVEFHAAIRAGRTVDVSMSRAEGAP